MKRIANLLAVWDWSFPWRGLLIGPQAWPTEKVPAYAYPYSQHDAGAVRIGAVSCGVGADVAGQIRTVEYLRPGSMDFRRPCHRDCRCRLIELRTTHMAGKAWGIAR